MEATIPLYSSRARDGVALIVAEGTFIYLNGSEWPNAPVMYNQSHVRAWKEVTEVVYQNNGKIFFQPWHPGPVTFLCSLWTRINTP